MGREIRHVPANWEHPTHTKETTYNENQIGEYIPLKDNYAKAIKKFEEDIKTKGLSEAIEYWRGGPMKDCYTDYEGKPLDWIQVYETVSEGTPVSPPFATPEELIDYLVNNGDFWDQQRKEKSSYTRKGAEAFVKEEWAPSFVMTSNGEMMSGVEAMEKE